MKWKPRVRTFLVLLIVCASGFGFASLAQNWNTERKLTRVSKDWAALGKAMRSLSIDNCGGFLPSDTSWRLDGRPTFETITLLHPDAPRSSYGVPCSRLLTEPIAYIKQYPEDPFHPGNGYGFVAWSYFDDEPLMALLHSPGPDGDIDISLSRLHAILHDSLEKNLEVDSPRFVFTEKTRACFLAAIDRFGYDPEKGPDGDLIQLYRQKQCVGFGQTETAPDRGIAALNTVELDALLAKWPQETTIARPRWRNLEDNAPSLEFTENWFPVQPALYANFEKYLKIDTPTDDDALESLTNRLVAFADFFGEVKPLTPDEVASLDQWRQDDPVWWEAIDRPWKHDMQGEHVFTDVNRYAGFYVFYGKSQLLKAGRLLEREKYKEAWRVACALEITASELHTLYHYAKPAPPLAERAGGEIYRMAHEVRELAEAHIPPEERR